MIAPPAFAPFGEEIVQLAYVVDDIAAAAQAWAVVGAGPFFTQEVMVPDGRYHGKPGPLRYEAAFAFHGGMNIELIQQDDPTPSVYRDHLDRSGPGFHHFMIRTGDYHETLRRHAAIGIVPHFEAALEGSGPWAYVDARPQLGCFIEIYEMADSVQHMWDSMRAVHETWNGERPLRQSAELFA